MQNTYVLFIYIIILFTELPQRGRFTGFSPHVSTTDDNQSPSLWYKDEQNPSTLIFTTPCIYSRRYITFLNER